MKHFFYTLLFGMFINHLQLHAVSYNTQERTDKFCKTVQKNKQFCMAYKVSYPVTENAVINQTIHNHLPVLDAKHYVNTLHKEIGEVISLYTDHYDEVYISILSVTQHTFTLHIRYHTYHGGAHPSYGGKMFNYHKLSGQMIDIDTLFMKNYQPQLSILAEKRWLEEREDVDPSYEKKLDSFQLPETIGIGKTGLVFHYGQFEGVARNAYFIIPYQDLNEILNPNSPIHDLLYNNSNPQSLMKAE